MRILKIKETCLYVHDLQRAYEFYQGILKLEVVGYIEHKHLFLKAGASMLLLFNPEDSKQKKSPPAHYAHGKQHFAFEVPAVEYDHVKHTLASKGIDIIDEVTWPSGNKSFYFNDPEENVLEIVPDKGIWE
jgi:catechol 2,3-dioxygenase-like lactoylglutathione lyase family enzyme